MRRIARGFTVIELLVVVSVIGILATISLTGFNRFQVDARDAHRSASATIISEALEKYYDANGEYPSCPMLTASASSVADILPGIDKTVLQTPQDPIAEDNSIKCQDLTPADSDVFAYIGDGSGVCATGNACLQFALKYKEESSDTVKTIASRRTTDILTSGDIADLSASAYSFSQIDLTWSAIGGAVTYNVQYATNAAFTAASTFTPAPTSNSVSVTGLSLGTQYYFRVQPASTTITGNWSNTASATTYTLDTPIATAVPDPSAPASQIKLTWAPITNASSYTVNYNSTGNVDGSGALTSPTVVSNATSPYILSSLPAGSTRYFKVKANAAGYTSGWSETTSTTTQVPAPTCLTATTNTTTQITADWTSCPVSVADNYTLEYDDNASFTAPTTTITGIVTTSRAVTGLTPGKSYWFGVYALVGSTSSSPNVSPTATATTLINAPTGTNISTTVPGATRRYDAGDWITTPGPTNWYYARGSASASCASGTTKQFRFGANYNSPTTFHGWTGWTTTTTKYMVAPNSGYSIRFHVESRCVGSNATSSSGSDVSGYVGP